MRTAPVRRLMASSSGIFRRHRHGASPPYSGASMGWVSAASCSVGPGSSYRQAVCHGTLRLNALRLHPAFRRRRPVVDKSLNHHELASLSPELTSLLFDPTPPDFFVSRRSVRTFPRHCFDYGNLETIERHKSGIGGIRPLPRS